MSSSTSSSSDEKQKVTENGVQHIGLLNAVNDLYGGVIVNIKEPMDSNVYARLLKASISQWRQQGKKGVWIKLPTQLANLVEPTIKEGFWYHHAEPDYVMLVYWIPDAPHTIPANASHTVGIGAFVINNKNEVLVVLEKNGYFKGKDVWKFPTGVVNVGEDICMAAMRETKEETGIDTEFLEVLAFSQTHGTFFGKSDLFFVCMLRPLSLDIKKQDAEVEAAQWMPIEMYAEQPYNQKHESFKYVAQICMAKASSKKKKGKEQEEEEGEDYTGFRAVPTNSSSGKTSFLYCKVRDMLITR